MINVHLLFTPVNHRSLHYLFVGALLVACSLLVSCKSWGKQVYAPDIPPRAVVRDGVAITLSDQKLTVFSGGKKVKDYSISSSKFGIGATVGSRRTPLGIHAVTSKTGEGQPKGMVFKGCRPTGEVVGVDAAGRDPIVTRVIQLAGLESFNRNSFGRRIYIHGTPEERFIGRPASYGCIRMKSDDIVDLFGRVRRGVPVAIESCTQETYMKAEADLTKSSIELPTAVVASLPKDGPRLVPTRKRYGRRSYARGARLAGSRKSKFSSRKSSRRLVSTRKGRSRR